MSIAELRARLKKVTQGNDPQLSPLLPLKTCIDILMKLQPTLSTKFWFSQDGKEIVTAPVLDKEIIAYLRSEQSFRAKISEIARALNMDQSVIESRCFDIKSVETILSDVILVPDFWDQQIHRAEKIIDRSGSISIAQLAEQLALPLDLVTTKIAINFTISTDGTNLVSEKFMNIVIARLIGTLNGLAEPRPLTWLADTVKTSCETVRCLLEDKYELRSLSNFGEISPEGIYFPKRWIRNEADSSERSLTRFGYCSCAGLRALVLEHGKEVVDQTWRSSENIQLANYFILIDPKWKKIVFDICETDGWCDMKPALLQHGLLPGLVDSEYGQIFDLVVRENEKFSRATKAIIVDENRILKTVSEQLAESIVKAAEKIPTANRNGSQSPPDLDSVIDSQLVSKIHKVLQLQFAITNLHFRDELTISAKIRIREILKKEFSRIDSIRKRPQISDKLANLTEDQIIDKFFILVESLEGLAKLASPEQFIFQMREKVWTPFVDQILSFAQCQFNLPPINEDRRKLIKSVPTGLEQVRDALKFFDSRVSISLDQLDEIKTHLRSIGIIISEKMYKQKMRRNLRKIRSDLLNGLETVSKDDFDSIGRFILFELLGCRFDWLSNLSRPQWNELFSSISVSDEYGKELISKFLSSSDVGDLIGYARIQEPSSP